MSEKIKPDTKPTYREKNLNPIMTIKTAVRVPRSTDTILGQK